MAREASESRALTRRAQGVLRTAFDEGAPRGERLRARTTAAASVAGVGAVGLLSGSELTRLASDHPAALHAAALTVLPLLGDAGQGLGFGAAAGVVVGLAGIVRHADRDSPNFDGERRGADPWLGRVRTSTVIAGGGLGLLAAGLGALDAIGATHSAVLDGELTHAAITATAAALGVAGIRRLNRGRLTIETHPTKSQGDLGA